MLKNRMKLQGERRKAGAGHAFFFPLPSCLILALYTQDKVNLGLSKMQQRT